MIFNQPVPIFVCLSLFHFARYFGGHNQVSRLASKLSSLGVTRGSRVLIYMPLIPEAIVSMLATNRIGAIHSVVFGGTFFVVRI